MNDVARSISFVLANRMSAVHSARRKEQSVVMDLYKGVSRVMLGEHGDTGGLLMFRLSVRFLGDLRRVGIDTKVAKEIIETIDVDFDLIELFFTRKYRKSIVKRLLYPLIDLYHSVGIGEKVGEIEVSFTDFQEFVVYMRFLCYGPIKDENVL